MNKRHNNREQPKAYNEGMVVYRYNMKQHGFIKERDRVRERVRERDREREREKKRERKRERDREKERERQREREREQERKRDTFVPEYVFI